MKQEHDLVERTRRLENHQHMNGACETVHVVHVVHVVQVVNVAPSPPHPHGPPSTDENKALIVPKLGFDSHCVHIPFYYQALTLTSRGG